LKGNEKKFLIVGVGNLYRGDDSVGILIARYFRRCFKNSVKIVDIDISFEELIDIWGDFDLVILVDAVHSGKGAGEIYRFEDISELLKSGLKLISSHHVGIVEYIELAKLLGSLPKRFIVYGISGENFEIGGFISPNVKDACRRLIPKIVAEVKA